MGEYVVGRQAELAAVADFLDPIEHGFAALVLEGAAGIGKTTVWRHGVNDARSRGFSVLAARPLEMEMQIPFAGVRDLLDGVLDEVLQSLAAPQRLALETALLLAAPDGPPPEPGAIPFALHSGLKILARRGPVLVAVDDVQWLDKPSAGALSFAARRLGEAPVCFLLAQRPVDEPPALDLERVVEPGTLHRLVLGPLSLGALQHILHAELDSALPRPLLAKVHAASGGNPFFALELTRALARRGAELEPGQPLPVPGTLTALVEERLGSLRGETVRALEPAALLSEPTLALVRAACDGDVDLSPAAEAGVIELDDGRIRFSHPLLASGIVARIEPELRRGLHRRLAAVVPDAEQRARHVALGAEGEDAEAAAALEHAARLARARGAPEAGAELLERALMHTPPGDTDARAARLIAASEAARDAGDWQRALAHATEASTLMQPGRERARALLLVGETSDDIAALEQALAESGEDASLKARIYTVLAPNWVSKDFRTALRLAGEAVAEGERAGDARLLAQALVMRAWFEGARMAGDAEATARAAAGLEQDLSEVRGEYTSTFTLATIRMWRDEHARARDGFRRLVEHADRQGDVWGRAHALLHLAQVEWRAGNWRQAQVYADDGLSFGQSADPAGRVALLWIGSVVAAHRGELAGARRDALEGLSAAGENLLFRARNTWVAGFVALCAGEFDDAVARLEETAGLFDKLGAREPGMRLFLSDLLEAYVTAGLLDEAEALAHELVRLGGELARPRATAIGTRGRGLVLAARGEFEAALEELHAATVAGEAWTVPFEEARTLLALGDVQRQARRRREARATLGRALETFERLGAPIFAERARSELARIGGRTPAGESLTPAEERIAALVAQGLTNREVAANLVVAVHTVEATLTRIYRKLGVRSRTELARSFRERVEAN